MIAKLKRKSGPSGSSVGYIVGVMREKDQLVRIVDYNGFALSRLKIAELEKVPVTNDEKKAHKKKVWQIANELSKVFDARAGLADYRVIDPLEEYIISFVDEERERLLRVPTAEERAEYGMPKLEDGETEDRTLEKIILDELLSKIGVHGVIEKKLRRKRDGTKYTVMETVERDAMYLAVGHDGTAHPHMHVLTARPDADGKVNDTRNEKRRIVAAIREMSRKYKLSLKLEGYEVNVEKTNLGYATKLRIRDAVKDALLSAANHEELAEILSEVAVFPTWKVHAEKRKEYGILFSGIDRNGKEHTWSGSQIDRSLSYGRVETALARNLAKRKAKVRLAAEKLAGEPETFVIHSGSDATLYINRQDRKQMEKLYEAARSILKYYTWAADTKCNEPKEFVKYAENGQMFGSVRFYIEKARFVAEKFKDGMLENPDEVVQFIDQDGQALNLFTPDFWTEWRRRLVMLKNSPIEEDLIEPQPVEKAPASSQKQEKTPQSAAKPVQPAATPALPDLIHITVENAFTVKLPNGYGVFNKNGHQYLGTPTVAGQEIRGDGIYLERRKNGSWRMYPPGTYDAMQKPKERAEEPKKNKPIQSRGPKF